MSVLPGLFVLLALLAIHSPKALGGAPETVFESSFETIPDGAPIPFSELPPAGSILEADSRPEIGLAFKPPVSGSPEFTLTVDGIDRTSETVVAGDRIRHAVPGALAEGQHVVRVTMQGHAVDWTFTTKTAPEVTLRHPLGLLAPSALRPELFAVFQDEGAGVNPEVTRFWLDGSEVTALSTLTDQSARFLPASDLADGEHTATVQVTDRVGNVTSESWAFVIANNVPVISEMAPNNTMLAFGSRPSIGAAFSVAGTASLSPAQVRLFVNSVDVTEQIQVQMASSNRGTVHFVPDVALGQGSYSVRLEVGASNGATGVQEWQFDVDLERVYRIDIVSPPAASTSYEPLITAAVKIGSSVGAPRDVSINGVKATDQQVDGPDTVYSRRIRLQPGQNQITARARFEDAAIRTASATVMYQPPPTITFTTPSDFAILGPLPPGEPTSGNAMNLTGNVERPIRIAGVTSTRVASVSINQQQAQLSADGLSFSFERYFLHEGTNMLNATAVDVQGRTVSSHITVYLDQTAPILNVEVPAANSMTSQSRIDVLGLANDAVEAWVNADEVTVRVHNHANDETVTALVSDRYFHAARVPLEIGNNELTVTASDQHGNERSRTVSIARIAVGSKRLTVLSGQGQHGMIQQELPVPLMIAAVDQSGDPVVDLPVRFSIERGSGALRSANSAQQSDGVNAPRSIQVVTDASGTAKVWLTLGTAAHVGSDRVRVSAEQSAEDVWFVASAQRGPVSRISVFGATGFQYAQTNSSPLEALTAVAQDAERNSIPGHTVRFEVIRGDAFFDAGSNGGNVSPDGKSVSVTTDKSGLAIARPRIGSLPGLIRIRAVDTTNPQADSASAVFQLQSVERRTGSTILSGVVQDHVGVPVSGVRISIGRTNLSVLTDVDGRFEFANDVPPGKIDLFIDGRDVIVNRLGRSLQYPALHFETAVIQGTRNQLPHAIYLPPIDLGAGAVVGGDHDVTLQVPGVEGFEMIVKANSVTFPDGSRTGPLIVTAVHGDRLPMVPPAANATFGAIGWTIQPTGTRFDPPIEVRIPNANGMKAGETASIVQWDHDLATFVPMGRATVNESATQIVTDLGSGLTKAGWGGCGDCPPVPPNDANNDDDECEVRSARAGQATVTADGKQGDFFKAVAALDTGEPDPAGTVVEFVVTPPADCGEATVSWDFGDNSPAGDTEFSTTHTFMETGEYNVAASLTCSECDDPVEPGKVKVTLFSAKITTPTDSVFRYDTTPAMPSDLEFEAEVTPDSVADVLSYEWSMESKYHPSKVLNGVTMHGRDDSFKFPETGADAKSGRDGLTWTPDWRGKLVASSEIKVKLKAFHSSNPEAASEREAEGFKIYGENPTTADVLTELGSTPWFVRRLASHESGHTLQQFDDLDSGAGVPKYGPPMGYGIMQLDPASELESYNWRDNINGGQNKVSAGVGAAAVFWTRQVTQYEAYLNTPGNPHIDVHADVNEGGVGCLFSHTGTNGHTFEDAIAIKIYNGAERHYMSWKNNNLAPGQLPFWQRSELNNLGFNYVNRVCNTAEP